MKATLFVLAVILNFFTSNAQTHKDVEIFGYTQPVSRGVSPEIATDEAGNAKTKSNKAGRNYFIYVALPASLRIYPIEMWLNGERYSAKPETINKTPVQMADPSLPGGPNLITLVPRTTKKVLMLIPGNAQIQGKTLSIAKAKAKTNELVVIYKMSGKFYFAALQKLDVLEAAVMQ